VHINCEYAVTCQRGDWRRVETGDAGEIHSFPGDTHRNILAQTCFAAAAYDDSVKCAAGFLICACLAGQSTDRSSHSAEIQVPAGVKSESLLIRYVLSGETFGGWVEPRAGVTSYVISTALAGGSATGIKAILYARGCSIQTLDIRFSNAVREQYLFGCRPLSRVPVTGRLTRFDTLHTSEVKIEARYIARWASAFLGLGKETVPIIPLGEVSLSADGRFSILVPDFAHDPEAGTPGQSGELQFRARGSSPENMLVQLVPDAREPGSTLTGGLSVLSEYPPEIRFHPCGNVSSLVRSSEGFAIRGALDPCAR
jgi:hypothetical protein